MKTGSRDHTGYHKKITATIAPVIHQNFFTRSHYFTRNFCRQASKNEPRNPNLNDTPFAADNIRINFAQSLTDSNEYFLHASDNQLCDDSFTVSEKLLYEGLIQLV